MGFFVGMGSKNDACPARRLWQPELWVVKWSHQTLVREPPVEVGPKVIRRVEAPSDVECFLLHVLEADSELLRRA